MFFAVQVPRGWLVSKGARQIYSFCAVTFVVLGGVYILVPLQPPISNLVLLPYALACATLWTAMWYFWFTVHPVNAFGKGYWGLLMLIGPAGSLIYFLLVYLRYRPSAGGELTLSASA
jgi:hypothetical protein